MYGNSADRIIHTEYIIQEPYAKDYQKTRYNTYTDRTGTVHNITSGGNTNKTCQRSIQTHGNIRFTIFDPGKDHTYNSSDCRSNSCCYENGTKLIYACCSCTVKTIPAKPQDEYTQAADWKVMSWESIDTGDLTALVFCKFTDTRSK